MGGVEKFLEEGRLFLCSRLQFVQIVLSCDCVSIACRNSGGDFDRVRNDCCGFGNAASEGLVSRMEMSDLVSPKQVSRAIGVSESSLKRWCDQGLLQTVRTAGGHRKIEVSEVVRFIRDRNLALRAPEVLDLPPVSERAELGLVRGQSLLTSALLAGNELLVRQIIFDLYLAKHPVCVICDEVLAVAFREIGERWACQEADPFQERRGCEIAVRVMFDLRRCQRPPEPALNAIGGTIEGDQYSIPSTMAELVLRDAGWNAVSLGTSLPFSSLIRAVVETRPRLFWLSVSYIPPSIDFIKEFARLSQACMESGAALVVGGRALTESLRLKMTYSAYCDTMQHLERFARTHSHVISTSAATSTGDGRVDREVVSHPITHSLENQS